VESFRSVSDALESTGGPANLTATRESIDSAIQSIIAAPRIDDESEKYRNRLLDLLTQQKSIVSELIQSPPMNMNRFRLRQDEDALITRHNRFVSDHKQWWPGFLKQHGYREGNSNDS
jgi:hypothetical protein